MIALLSALWWLVYRPYADERDAVRVNAGLVLCGQPWRGAAGCVVDGDTIVIGNGPGRRRVRFTGFDAPELDGACPQERVKAEEARRALHRWLGEGPFVWSGGSEPPRDQYGRELRAAWRIDADGSREDLADTMIAAGLAGASGWGSEPADWCR